ncbi:hypothetical protein [Salinibacterium sp. SWN1162]|uniref:hypothetical protein n=1 Tax=Salinibacterium sp. SWN1162 TaxID=2792053 RepID=UPI0018CD469D|nr:hypothetical protein [Salinibacterium sp. SWN1162]MBH0010128.1 hypothetical protein [Salinibacterium sp. SWN1162]
MKQTQVDEESSSGKGPRVYGLFAMSLLAVAVIVVAILFTSAYAAAALINPVGIAILGIAFSLVALWIAALPPQESERVAWYRLARRSVSVWLGMAFALVGVILALSSFLGPIVSAEDSTFVYLAHWVRAIAFFQLAAILVLCVALLLTFLVGLVVFLMAMWLLRFVAFVLIIGSLFALIAIRIEKSETAAHCDKIS